MKYTKPAKTHEEQISLLKSRGMIIADDERAMRWLKRVGYYRFSGYSYTFKKPGSDDFKDGLRFENVTNVYKFDCRLRLLFLQAIDRIEVAIRTAITYEFAHSLGPFGYADPANFSRTYKHKDFMKMLEHEEGRASEMFLVHFRTKYHLEPHLPVWMMTEIVSFGTLSKLTENARASIRKRIGKEFLLAEPVFISWLHTLSSIRNLCAHHNRLWNRGLPVQPILPNEWVLDGIDNDRLYCVALMVRHLLSIVAPKNTWKERLKDAFAKHPEIDRAAMKFPAKWEELEGWK
jgi:abortive infection bacteriophage resistance protein